MQETLGYHILNNMTTGELLNYASQITGSPLIIELARRLESYYNQPRQRGADNGY